MSAGSIRRRFSRSIAVSYALVVFLRVVTVGDLLLRQAFPDDRACLHSKEVAATLRRCYSLGHNDDLAYSAIQRHACPSRPPRE